MKVDCSDVIAARETIRDTVKNTQLDCSRSASQILGAQTFFKYENDQLTGSFKIRGALNKIRNLTADERSRGVIACSAGNHAQGVAHSAALEGISSTIVMPETAPLVKTSATRGYGAEVRLHGQIFDEALAYAQKLQQEKGLVLIHPFADPLVIAGQGTIALEILEAESDFDSVVVPLGGGGLISGMATVMKHLNPKTRIIGVQSDQAPGMHELFKNDKVVVRKGRIRTIADGIAVKVPNKEMYDNFISKLVDDVITVSDLEIAEAMVFLLERAKSLTEGSGAAALAAALAGKADLGKKTCIVLSGGNADLNIISSVIDKGLQSKGRLAEISVIVEDLPGRLSQLTEIIAKNKANVLEVHHHRRKSGVYLRETQIDFVIETSGDGHDEEIKEQIRQLGIKIN